MPEDVNAGVVATPAETQQEGTAPLGATPSASTTPAATQAAGGTTVPMPTSAIKKIKEEQYQKGLQAAKEEMARDAGYASYSEFVAALKRPAAPTPAASTQPAAGGSEVGADEPATDERSLTKDERRAQAKFERQLEKAVSERNRYATTLQQKERELKAKTEEVEHVRAEMQLRMLAARVGIQDVDYAMHLFYRHLEQLPEDQVASLNEQEWFGGLRKTMPLIFGEAVVPATTGTGAGGAPTPPKPSQVAAQNGKNGRVDVRTMTPQDYQKHLRERGIQAG